MWIPSSKRCWDEQNKRSDIGKFRVYSFRHPFLDSSGPVAIAHRGYASRYPENTMAAFQAAVDLGFGYVETDVRATADDEIVAFHDETLERVANADGAISEMDWSAVRKVEIGSERIPRLRDILDAWPDLKVNIDPKHDCAVGPLLGELKNANAWERVCVGSFSSGRLDIIRRAAGAKLCTSMGQSEVLRLWLAGFGAPSGRFAADCAQVPISHRGITVVTPRFIAAARNRNFPVHVWTVNEKQDMVRLLDIGVDGIMTDRAEDLKEVFGKRGLPLHY